MSCQCYTLSNNPCKRGSSAGSRYCFQHNNGQCKKKITSSPDPVAPPQAPKLVVAPPPAPKLVVAPPQAPKLVVAPPPAPKLVVAPPPAPKLVVAPPPAPKLVVAPPQAPKLVSPPQARRLSTAKAAKVVIPIVGRAVKSTFTALPSATVKLPMIVHKLSDFQLLSAPSASGTYGSVIVAKHNTINTGQIILKKYNQSIYTSSDGIPNNINAAIVKEYGILGICNQYQLRHSVECYGLAVSDSLDVDVDVDVDVYLILEKMTQTLTDRLRTLPRNNPQFKQIYRQTLIAMDEFHRLGFIHGDIKGDNIMFDSTGNIKLIDFGLSCFGGYIPNTDSTRVYNTSIRAPDNKLDKYPENFWQSGNRVSFQSDVYAIASVFSDITSCDGTNLYNYYGKLIVLSDPLLQDLTLNMMNPNASLRYTAKRALSHPYFQGAGAAAADDDDLYAMNGGMYRINLHSDYYTYTPIEVAQRSIELQYFEEIYNTYKQRQISILQPLSEYMIDRMIKSDITTKRFYGYDAVYNAIIANWQSTISYTGTLYSVVLASFYSFHPSIVAVNEAAYFDILNKSNGKLPFVSLWSLVSYYSIIHKFNPFIVAESLIAYLVYLPVRSGIQLNADDIVKSVINHNFPHLALGITNHNPDTKAILFNGITIARQKAQESVANDDGVDNSSEILNYWL
jgi:serine/threonine protein kinase